MNDQIDESAVAVDDDRAKIVEKAMIWQNFSVKILRDYLKVDADVSNASFYDIAQHLEEDKERMKAKASHGVRPAKHAAYLAFWVRKLKPVSRAFPLTSIEANRGRPPDEDEVIDINERLAIWIAFYYLREFCRMGLLCIHDGNEDVVIEFQANEFRAEAYAFCVQKLGIDGKRVFDTLIYDMRYRTFGPHHLVHLFDQFVFRLYARCADRRAKGLVNEDALAPAPA